jgi:hypothetical protein
MAGTLGWTLLFHPTIISGAEQSINDAKQSNYNSDNPNIRNGVLYNWPYVAGPEETQPSTKVSIASIKGGETITIDSKPRSQGKVNVLCSCVQALNAHFGTNFQTLDGFARSIPINSKTPASMGYVVTYESRPGASTGHIGHYYLEGSEIVVDWEANYEKCKISSGRTLPVGSSLIKGYIN